MTQRREPLLQYGGCEGAELVDEIGEVGGKGNRSFILLRCVAFHHCDLLAVTHPPHRLLKAAMVCVRTARAQRARAWDVWNLDIGHIGHGGR